MDGSFIHPHSIFLRASLCICQRNTVYAFTYLYCISDIISGITGQWCHQINAFTDLRLTCLGRWRRKTPANKKLIKKCEVLRASMRGLYLSWRSGELAGKRGTSMEQLCHVIAEQLLQCQLKMGNLNIRESSAPCYHLWWCVWRVNMNRSSHFRNGDYCNAKTFPNKSINYSTIKTKRFTGTTRLNPFPL